MHFWETAGSVSIEEVKNEWGKLLAQNEEIAAAYKLVRDYIILTQKRIIFINVKGITRKQIEISSYPYRSVVGFSVQTAGDYSTSLCEYLQEYVEKNKDCIFD